MEIELVRDGDAVVRNYLSFLSKDVRERRRHGMSTGHICMSMKMYCAVLANDAVKIHS